MVLPDRLTTRPGLMAVLLASLLTPAPVRQTTIAFRVTNKCRSLVSYVAIGTGGYTRVAPADRSSYNGDLSPYDVSWTGRGGTPGFENVKFTPTLKKFANSASASIQCCRFKL